MSYRILWSSLGLSPALASLLLPPEFAASLFSALGVPTTLAVFLGLALLVTHAARRAPATHGQPPLPEQGLLLRSAHVRPPVDLPAPDDQRRHLIRRLSSHHDRPAPGQDLSEPESEGNAISATLSRVIEIWNGTAPGSLTPEQVTELYLLEQVISGSADRAGALAQLFRKPDVVLEIRDRIGEIRRRRSAFEHQRSIYDATLRLWRNQSDKRCPAALLTALRALDAPDPDLWHRVILEHDATCPAQRAAALWCASQPSCDRASVASYLGALAADCQLDDAVLRGDNSWLDGVRSVIEAWNSGRYPQRNLALAPADAVLNAGPALSAMLDRLAEQTGTARWPDPRGVFAEYHGRMPRPRAAWSLEKGRLTAPPDLADYVDFDSVAA
ncbi:hypothetical protein [Puniceibacterium confluentis]|uniref:hypothetical protein n=3 Tax=Puniceibacterium confluentis TaxID=1958944 RepID=UPI0011B7F74E|nr:hypothetical protein [Puniceibacterium confluentis]